MSAAAAPDPVALALQALAEARTAAEQLHADLLAGLTPEERVAWEKSKTRRSQRPQLEEKH